MKNHQKVLDEFRKKVVMTLADLMQIDQWSPSTTHRYLKKWRALNSFNHNGMCYVLNDIPSFNDAGLWEYEGVRFSKYGNLTETIIALVANSKNGLSASEIGALVGSDVHPFLKRLAAKDLLNRIRKTRGYVYISADPKIREAQEKSIYDQDASSASKLSSEKTVAILVEKIKNPELDANEIAVLLRRKGIDIQGSDVADFLSLHGIGKKK